MRTYKIEGMCGKVFSKDIVIYGLGMGAVQRFVEFNRNLDGNTSVDVRGFVDSKSQKSDRTFCGRRIYSLSEVKAMENEVEILIATYNAVYVGQILRELDCMGIESNVYYLIYPCECQQWDMQLLRQNNEKIQQIRSVLEDERSREVFDNILKYRETGDFQYILRSVGDTQYFPAFLQLRNDEIFVDCGAYCGDTTLEFLKYTNGNYKKIYAFEPDEDLAAAFSTVKEIKKIENLEIMRYGVWNESTALSFEHIGNGSSKIDDLGEAQIKVTSLDEVLYEQEKPISYVKMDVEGAEYQGLLGMKKIISRDKPKLAICVYHKQEDLWVIPDIILKLNPDYKIYMRHHSAIAYHETVCYAI